MDIVKADWAEELAGLQNRPDAIKYALEHVGNKAPMVDDFKALCNRAPVYGLLKLEAPKANQDVIDKALAMARQAFRGSITDPLHDLRELAASDARDGTYKGRKVTRAQRETYRKALGMDGKQA